MKRLMFLIVIFMTLGACSNSLHDAMEEYQHDMSDIYEADRQLKDLIDSFDLSIFDRDNELLNNEELKSELNDISTMIEDEIIPLHDSISQQLSMVEVPHDDISEAHEIFVESYGVKYEFLNEFDRYVDISYQSIAKSEELVRLSQMFIENQEIRSEYIESAETDEEIAEIEMLIEQINANSEELDETARAVQLEITPQEKQSFIDDTLNPLIEGHIRALNEINLDTDLAIRVRSITLEMYYGYEKYYSERRDTIYYNDELERLQINTILQLIDVYENLDMEYEENLRNLIEGN